jgi:hypothetical protein
MTLLEGIENGKLTTWLGQRGRKCLTVVAVAALFLLNLNVAWADGSASIGDYVWDDQNGDGKQGSEFDVGINGVEIELWLDNDGDGQVSDGDEKKETTITDDDGEYFFTGLIPGDYVVKVADSNFESGGTLYGYALTTDSNPMSVHLGEGEAHSGADFGYVAVAYPAGSDPTAVTLSSFMASSASQGASHWPWSAVFLATLVAVLSVRRRGGQNEPRGTNEL